MTTALVAILNAIEDRGYTVSFVDEPDIPDHADGMTHGPLREVRIRQGLSAQRTIQVAAHELAHVVRRDLSDDGGHYEIFLMECNILAAIACEANIDSISIGGEMTGPEPLDPKEPFGPNEPAPPLDDESDELE